MVAPLWHPRGWWLALRGRQAVPGVQAVELTLTHAIVAHVIEVQAHGRDLALQGELRRALPGRHVEFMGAMPLTHVEGDYLFVHAGIRPGVPLA